MYLEKIKKATNIFDIAAYIRAEAVYNSLRIPLKIEWIL